MNLETLISANLSKAVKTLYGVDISSELLQVQSTRKEFEGDLTAVVFPILKISKKSPEQTAEDIGKYLFDNVKEISSFNVVKGFLNLTISDDYWLGRLNAISRSDDWGLLPGSGKKVMVEYSSPNTNKPLHLGHIRNNLLGWSVSKLLEFNGHEVIKVNLIDACMEKRIKRRDSLFFRFKRRSLGRQVLCYIQ